MSIPTEAALDCVVCLFFARDDWVLRRPLRREYRGFGGSERMVLDCGNVGSRDWRACSTTALGKWYPRRPTCSLSEPDLDV